MIFDLNVTSKSIDVQVVDDDGLPVTGLLAATFPTVKYSKAGANADVTITLADLATIGTAWADGGLKERGEGVYRLDLPNAVFTASAIVTIRGETTGKRVICPKLDVSPQLTGTTIGGISGGGTGARTVTVTVQTSGAVAIQGALVRMVKGAESFTQTTNVSGQCTFNLDDGTWTVSITAAGYSFAGASLVVDGTETPTYTMTTTGATPPADPAFCLLRIRCWTTGAVVAVGVSVKVQVSEPPDGVGEMFSDTIATDTTGADGYADFTVPRGCSVKYWVNGSEKNLDSVGTADATVYVDNWLGDND